MLEMDLYTRANWVRVPGGKVGTPPHSTQFYLIHGAGSTPFLQELFPKRTLHQVNHIFQRDDLGTTQNLLWRREIEVLAGANVRRFLTKETYC